MLEEKIGGLEVRTELVLLAFHANWCASCQLVFPTLNVLEKEQEKILSVIKVDVDIDTELTEKYGVVSIPTMLLLKNGIVVDSINGVTSLPSLNSRIQAVLD